jgi:hypothetical protein
MERAMTLDIYTLAGFAGALIVVIAYFANQVGRLPSDDWRFPGANLLGSLLILMSFYTGWNFPSLVIEIFWVAISVYGLVRWRWAT